MNTHAETGNARPSFSKGISASDQASLINGDQGQPQRWPGRRWWIFISLVLGGQLALIFWLGRPPSTARAAPRKEFVPELRVVGPAALEVLAFTDPTLFALPHREGFSGLAWLNMPTQDFRNVPISEPPLLPGLEQVRLAEDFKDFMQTNQAAAMPLLTPGELVLQVPSVRESVLSPKQSTLRLTGGLAGRRLGSLPVLPSWQSQEILSNSVVQVLVAASGETISGVLLNAPGSGSAEADQYALREARKARFEPLPSADPLQPLSGIASGQMVFQWRTVAPAATNAPSTPK